MSKGEGWVPIDKMMAQEFKQIKRPFSKIEAMFSYSMDINCGKSGSINGYSTLWGWSRNKVRKFITESTGVGHFIDNTGARKGHAIHFIDAELWEKKRTGKGQARDRQGTGKGQEKPFDANGNNSEEDRQGTGKGQARDRQGDTTINPNPNPNPKQEQKPPFTPQGEPPKPKKNPFKDYLLRKIQAEGYQDLSDQIITFFEYRMKKPKAKQYQSEKGINGLFRNLGECRDAGLNLFECLEITMEGNWQTPKPEYFKNNFGNKGPKNGKNKNYTGKDDRPSVLEDRLPDFSKY